MDMGFVFFWIVFIAIMIMLICVSRSNMNRANQELQKIIEATGAKWVRINSRHGRDILRWKVSYTDAHGHLQKRNVIRGMSGMGRPKGNFYWDKPLTSPPQPSLPSPSKEQLVSEMSAEIKRLEAELAAATTHGGYHG